MTTGSHSRSTPVLLTLALLALATPLAATDAAAEPGPPAPPELGRRIDAWVRPLDDAGQLSGTLLVAREGTVVYERSFGAASQDLSVPNDPATRFNVASVTKPLTAILAIRLIEEGKLAQDDPLSRWLPAFPRGDEITIGQLLSHRAGIPHRVTTDAEETHPQTAADMADLAAGKELLFEPGSRTSYSSAGYSVLARVLELAGGRSYSELLEDLVLAPAGAVHTVGRADSRHPLAGRAQGFFLGPDGPLNAPLKDLSFLVGAGSVYSTPRDLLAIQRAVLDGTYGEAVRKNLVRDSGLAWNGYTDGYQAFADYHAETGLTVILTANLFSGANNLVRRTVPRIAAGEEVPPAEVPAFEPVALSSEIQAHDQGTYELGPGSLQTLRFQSADGTLATLGDWVLIPTSDDTFFSPQDYSTVTVERDETGRAVALAWGPPGKGPRFARVADPDAAE